MLYCRGNKKSCADDFAALEEEADFFLAKTIQSLEEKMGEPVVQDHGVEDESAVEDDVGTGDVCAKT